MQVVEDDLLHLLVDLLLLAEDDIPLPLNRTTLEGRVLEDIANDIHARVHVLREALGVVDRLLPGGVRVEVRTEALNRELELVLGPAVGSLEGHVLKEMRRAVRRIRLRPRPRVDPHAHRRSLRMRVCFCRYREAIW